MPRVDINICTRDRPSELALLLQSLRTQTFQDFDVQIVDGSQVPINQSVFCMKIISQMKLEGHDIKIEREKMPGVCAARNQNLEMGQNPLVCRIDDDSICESNFLEDLHAILAQQGLLNKNPKTVYDDRIQKIGAVGCVVPSMGIANHTRKPKEKLSEIKVDKDGNITEICDDLWPLYEPNIICEVDHVRSSFMFWREASDKIKKEFGEVYDTGYGLTGFREETDFSLKLKMLGYKLLVNTAAINWHLQCAIGGVRSPDYAQRVQMGDVRLKRQVKKWIKEKKLNL